jgi:DNA (cytosine-5)-methyltransferase 1
MKSPSLVSLFTGAGGLDLGLEQAGFETVFANEIEPYACESLRANRVLRSLTADEFDRWFNSQIAQQRCYKNVQAIEIARLRRRLFSAFREPNKYLEKAHIVERDIRALPASEVLEATGHRPGQIDLVAGGPPCQPFSRAGKRELIESDTGQLFLDFVRLVEGLRPRWFLFENVKGLILHKADVAISVCPTCKHREPVSFGLRDSLKDAAFFESICSKCKSVERHSILWEKRKAGSLDIIQSEFERIGYKCHSIVLNAADFGAPQHRERLFIVGSRDGERIAWPSTTHAEADSTRRAPTLFDSMHLGSSTWKTMADALYQSGHWRYGVLDPDKAVLWVKNVVRPHDEPVTWTLNRPAPTIGAHQAAKLAIAPFGVPEEQLHRQQWHVLGRRQGDTAPVFVEHEYLNDEELLTIQTFPTSWYLYGTRMQRAFQIGNAVPPILARVVGEAILKTMNHKTQQRAIDTEILNEQRYASRI